MKHCERVRRASQSSARTHMGILDMRRPAAEKRDPLTRRGEDPRVNLAKPPSASDFALPALPQSTRTAAGPLVVACSNRPTPHGARVPPFATGKVPGQNPAAKHGPPRHHTRAPGARGLVTTSPVVTSRESRRPQPTAIDTRGTGGRASARIGPVPALAWGGSDVARPP
jgi:hypothetical protein